MAKRSFGDSLKAFFQKDLVQYIIKRVLMFIPTILLISILVFFVIQLPPGDYVSAHIAALATEGELVDADYAASNACYEKIGYVLRGSLCTVTVKG